MEMDGFHITLGTIVAVAGIWSTYLWRRLGRAREEGKSEGQQDERIRQLEEKLNRHEERDDKHYTEIYGQLRELNEKVDKKFLEIMSAISKRK